MVDTSDGHLVASSIALTEFGDEGCVTRVLMSTPLVTVMLTGFMAGQKHREPGDTNVALVVLDGGGETSRDGKSRELRVGDVAILPAGSLSTVSAGAGGMILLHVASPVVTRHGAISSIRSRMIGRLVGS